MIFVFVFVLTVINPIREVNRKNAIMQTQVGTLQCEFNQYSRSSTIFHVQFIFKQITIKGNLSKLKQSNLIRSIKTLCSMEARVTIYYRHFNTFLFFRKMRMFDRLVTENGEVISKY